MLHSMHLAGVGPADELKLDLAPRLNVITGDNGLGKSFLLDAAWWVLTRTWASYPLEPRSAVAASITFEVDIRRGKRRFTTTYDRASLSWTRNEGRPPIPGLVLYARADGGFAVWDPHRNYWREAPSQGVSDGHRPEAFLFDPDEVWNGKETDGRRLCNGLIRDWVDWQLEESEENTAFAQLRRVLARLSPEVEGEKELRPGKPTRLPGDSRRFPTLDMGYGEVPIIYASAGMRRIAALGYLLVWAFSEHQIASRQMGKPPERRIIFLIDEIEAHLAPRWQRVVLPALLDVMDALSEPTPDQKSGAEVQFIISTHSPLLLASLEPHFDEARDALWTLDRVNRTEVHLEKAEWERRGDASNWLTSVFDLKTSRSKEAEALIERLDRISAGTAPSQAEMAEIEDEMRSVLGPLDPLWARWREYRAFLNAGAKG